MNPFFTRLRFLQLTILLSALIALSSFLTVTAQTITVPSSNQNDSTDREPLGCFYGYERTEGLYLNSEIGTTGYITRVGFYVNSLNNPAVSTPVVIKMKTTSLSSLAAATYDTESAGAVTVWSGNVTNSMLSADNWLVITLDVSYNCTSNLEVFVETNYGSFGGESYDAKGIRQSNTAFNASQYWEEDDTLPSDQGELNSYRPNIQLTFTASCAGTPNTGSTLASINPVCTGSSFTLSLSNISTEPGLTYQWQSSPNQSTWTNISGATNATYTTTETATTYYRCIVTCTNGGASSTSPSLQVALQLYYHCYCSSYATTTEDTKIDSVHLGAINTGSDPGLCESYTDYTGGSSAMLTPGQPNILHIVNGACTGEAYEAYVAVYIDYNHNSSFTDASELVYSYGPIYTLNGIPDTTFFVPLTALSGNTGMRVVLEEGDQVASSCGTYTRGETEDYLVNIATIPACVGAPAADSTFSTLYSVCPGEDFTLSLKTYPAASGITFAWQQSTDNINYTSVPGIASTPIYVDTGGQTTGHYYRCKISCGGSFTYSYAIYISMNPFYKCYCNSSPSDPFTDTKIDTVKIGSISTGSDPNHCESYTDYTSLSTSLSIGIPAGTHIVNGSCDQQFYPAVVGVYIDYNQDGSFEIDSNELAFSYGPTTDLNSIPDGFITVPANAKLGTTGMRIILEEGDSVPSSCGNYFGGETEDYVVNIIGAGTCTDPPNPGTATASVTSICSGSLPLSFTVSLTGNSGGPGETYQWQSSTDGINFTDIPGQTTSTAFETINGGGLTTYYRVQVHCGATTLPSASVTVTVNPSPVGNTIGDPIVVIGFPYITDGNNLASNCWTSNYDTTSKQPSPDVFYQVFTNGDIGSLQISTCQTTDLNTYIHILNASQSHLHSNDNNGPLCTGVEASDTVHTDALNQYYYVVVEGKDTLQGTYHVEIHFITATDINPSGSPASEILIFPNPNNGTFNLTLNLNQDITDIATLSITNSIGQQLSEQKVTVVNGNISKEIALGNFAYDGLYIATLRLNDLTINKRFVIQR